MSLHGSVTVTEQGQTIKDILAFLDGVSGPPSYKTTTKLELALSAAFDHTQARTHVITGSLKSSGKTESDYTNEVWSGSLSYGGPLYRPPLGPGPPNDPVYYAIFEMARGGDHDFYAGLDAYERLFEAAINNHFWDDR